MVVLLTVYVISVLFMTALFITGLASESVKSNSSLVLIVSLIFLTYAPVVNTLLVIYAIARTVSIYRRRKDGTS